ncbi:hypothetical protein AVEN_46581-1 [Araneus ventricosus]|uniref:Uncharacterized protein n=1 Tax=Araneus ventricosus TaxID=182803 RepID=A0A4Y2ML17_ARAVE|nr:hypothetical protein AVEN_46581-1 [Araneus ventricosus]
MSLRANQNRSYQSIKADVSLCFNQTYCLLTNSHVVVCKLHKSGERYLGVVATPRSYTYGDGQIYGHRQNIGSVEKDCKVGKCGNIQSVSARSIRLRGAKLSESMQRNPCHGPFGRRMDLKDW